MYSWNSKELLLAELVLDKIYVLMEIWLASLNSLMRANLISFLIFFTAEKKQKREQHYDATQIGMGVNAYPGVYGAPQVSTVE